MGRVDTDAHAVLQTPGRPLTDHYGLRVLSVTVLERSGEAERYELLVQWYLVRPDEPGS